MKALDKEDLGPLDALPPRSFETERLKLRAVEPGDSKLLFGLTSSDPVATKYMSFKCANCIEDVEVFVEPAAQYFLGNKSTVHHFMWLISIKDGGDYIGSTGLGPLNSFTLSGGYILNRQYWGHGYAAEAWKCVVDWAKTQPGVFRIEATHHRDNSASGKVMEKCGMAYEGILKRQTVYPNVSDDPCDAVIYAWARE